MVEAALIFPMVILTVTALIYILLFFYQMTDTRAKMHIALRSESGKINETVFYEKDPEEPFPIYRKGEELNSYGVICFTQEGILKRQKKELSARKFLIDEVRNIRLADLLEGAGESEKK